MKNILVLSGKTEALFDDANVSNNTSNILFINFCQTGSFSKKLKFTKSRKSSLEVAKISQQFEDLMRKPTKCTQNAEEKMINQ